MLIYLLTYQLKLLPSSGMSNPYALSLGVGDVLVTRPAATTLAITEVAYWQRYQRDSLLNAMSEDYSARRARRAPRRSRWCSGTAGATRWSPSSRCSVCRSGAC